MFDVKLLFLLFFLAVITYAHALQIEGVNLAKKIRCFITGNHMEPYTIRYYKGSPTGVCPCCGKVTSLTKEGDWK